MALGSYAPSPVLPKATHVAFPPTKHTAQPMPRAMSSPPPARRTHAPEGTGRSKASRRPSASCTTQRYRPAARGANPMGASVSVSRPPRLSAVSRAETSRPSAAKPEATCLRIHSFLM